MLCFFYIFKVNTEYLCSILLIILNIFYILLFFTDIDGTSNINLFIFTSISIPIRIVVLIFWLLLIVSNSWLINTFDKLNQKFINNENGRIFGSDENYKIKKFIKLSLVCGSLLLILLHIISLQSVQLYIPKPIRLNTVKLIISVIGITITSFSIYLNDNLSSNTKTITQQ